MSCPLCRSSLTDEIDVNHPRFRHQDFATIKQSGTIGRCLTCQLLFNVVGEDDIAVIENQFNSLDYAHSKQTSQTVNARGHDRPVGRSELQADLLSRFIDSAEPSILDIGCFNGSLLLELSRRFQHAQLHGFDVNGYTEPDFPKQDQFHFWSSTLDDVPGELDLICMSHSIMYLRDIDHLSEQLNRLLKPDGLLFIQVPDISKNPYSILLGDSYYYYTTQILRNILRYFGFGFSLVENDWFPREIVGIAKRATRASDQVQVEDLEIYRCIRHIDEVVRNLNDISTASRIAVLGTTVNAAFVDSILGEQLDYFADENPNRVGTKFRRKDVCHPSSLVESDSLIIPYEEMSHSIKERFSRRYKGQFMCV